MKIKTRDDHVFQGTPLQMVCAMRSLALGREHLSVPSYVEWVVANALKFERVALDVAGETDDELAASLVEAMIRAGLTYRV